MLTRLYIHNFRILQRVFALAIIDPTCYKNNVNLKIIFKDDYQDWLQNKILCKCEFKVHV